MMAKPLSSLTLIHGTHVLIFFTLKALLVLGFQLQTGLMTYFIAI